jgi:hypothetical protein
MKKNIFNIIALIVVFGSGLLAIDGCKLKNPAEGIVVSIKADAVTAPSEILIKDARTGYQPKNITTAIPVTISGPGAPYIYSSGASKTISLFQGAVSFSLRKGTIVSISNPIKFTIHIDLPGYLPLEYPVVLTSLDPISETASVVDFNNPPKGAASKTATIETGADGKTTDTSSIFIPATIGKTESLKIAIEAGTKMLDASGAPVSGNIEAKVIQFTPSTEEAINAFSGGTDFNSIKDVNGNPLAAGGFYPAGWMDMTMSAGGKDVKSFDKALQTTFEINADLTNPTTKAKYKAGDVMDVYSKSEGSTDWTKEGTATIALNSTSGKLEATLAVKHLSVWAFGILVPKCGGTLTFSIFIPNREFGDIFYISKIGTYNGKPYTIARGQLFRVSGQKNGVGITTITSNVRPEQNTTYQIHSANEGLFYEGPLCGSIIDLGSPAAPNVLVNQVLIKCINGSSVLLPNQYKVYYIDDDEYNNTINNATGRKIDPRDGLVNGIYWKQTNIANVTQDGKEINTISLRKNKLLIGKKYRFALYYNDGREESRKDYITPATISQEVLDAGGQVIIVLGTCPI